MIERNEQETNVNVLKILHSNRWYILGLMLLFFGAALMVTQVTPKKYSALGVVYPTNSNSIKEVVNKPSFGYDVQADRLMQLFQSQMMRDKITKEFDLIQYYEIDTTSNGWRHSLKTKYDNDISFIRTKYLSVEVSVILKSAQKSADMVNFMLDYIDVIRQDVFEHNTKLLVNDLAEKLTKQEGVVDQLLVGIFNEVSEEGPNVLAENTAKIIDERKRKATSLYGDEVVKNAIQNHYSIQVEKMVNDYYFELGKLNNLRRDLAVSQEKLSLPFPKVYRLVSAVADEKKSSPSGLVNGTLGLLLGLVVGIFFFVGTAKWKSISESLLQK